MGFDCTVDPRYLDFDYFELPLISKRKYDHCFKIEIKDQVTEYCG